MTIIIEELDTPCRKFLVRGHVSEKDAVDVVLRHLNNKWGAIDRWEVRSVKRGRYEVTVWFEVPP